MITILSPRHARQNVRRALRRLRRANGLHQTQLAAILHVHPHTVGYRENGHVGIAAETLIETADALGYDVALISRQVTGNRPGARLTGTGWPT